MWWMALIGAAAGQASYFIDNHKQRNEIKRRRAQEEAAFNLQQEHNNSMFNLQKTEAMEQLGVQKRNLDTHLGLSFDDYNSNLFAQALGIQDARIQNSSAIGESLAAEGASGTRGNASNDMIRSHATQSLERNIDVQGKQNSNYLNQMITGANMTSDALNREKASWMNGGYKYQAKQMSDKHAQDMFDLKMNEYDNAYKSTEFNFLDFMTAGFGGANTGMSMGINFQNYWKEVGK